MQRLCLLSNAASSVSEVVCVDVAEELTNSLLGHIHDQVVELTVVHASGVALVNLNNKSSDEAANEGSHVVPGLVASAGREIHNELSWVVAEVAQVRENVNEALDVA